MNEISPIRAQRPALPHGTGAAYGRGSATEEGHLLDHWKVLVKRRNVVVLVLLLTLGLGGYVTLSSTPLYVASATIKIEPQNPTVTGVGDMLPSQAGAPGPYDYYQTQFALLRSRAIAAMVIRDLRLESNPTFINARVISANPVDRIKSMVFGSLQSLLFYLPDRSTQMQPSQRSRLGSNTEAIDINQQELNSPEPDVNLAFVERYLSSLKVKPVRNTRLVEVQFTSPDPELSQELANAHAGGFLRMNLQTRFELTKEAREFLDQKNAELKQKLETSEAALNRFRQIHGVISLEKGENIVVDRLVDLNRQLTIAKAQRIEAESLSRTVENKNSQYLSQVMKEGLVPTLKGNLATLESERIKLSTVFTPYHPRLVELSQQISEARKALNQEIANVVRGIDENYAAARAKEQALQAEADRQQQKALNLKQVGVEYAVLEEEVKVNRALYESVLKRLSETNVSNDLAISNMRIIERAVRPLLPSSPNTALNLVLSIFLGLFLSVGLVFFLEYLDSSVRTPQHVWQAVALSTFGVVPDLRSLNWRLLGWNFSARPLLRRLTQFPQQPPSSSSSYELILINHSRSLIAEFYRTIRTAFLFSQPEKPPQIVLLTSPLPGEGKTVTTLNLAIALAQDNHRVLVIDADLRKGACHTRLRMKNHNGLSNVLTGNLSLEEGIQATPVNGLSLLSHGICPPNPTDLLGSRKMREILHQLRESFNFILIDSPPAIPVTDAALLSIVCDGVILVFHGQKTTSACARQAVERLDAIRAPICGVILNGIDLADPSYTYYRNYYCSNGVIAEELKNGSETTINVAPVADLPEIKTSGGLAPGIVPPEFFDRMTSHLIEAVGPIATVMVTDQIALLRESQDVFPRSRLQELLEGLCQEILDDKLKNKFQRSMQEQLTNFLHADLPEKESWPGELDRGTVSPEFFPHMASKLTEVAGPMAPLIVRDQVALLGESLESFPKNRLKELVERICEEIFDQKLKTDFQRTMSSEIRSL